MTIVSIRRALAGLAAVQLAGVLSPTPVGALDPVPTRFETVELASGLGVVYAVKIADMNRDRRPDVVAITPRQVMWFANPGPSGGATNPGGWIRHVVREGGVHPDNVCFDVRDLDGDGHVDLVLGADWQPRNTVSGGSLQWLRANPPDDPAPWKVYALPGEPTLHRIRFGNVDRDPETELVVMPLHGRNNQPPDWQGAGLRVLIYDIPKNPVADPWPVTVADDSLHIAHNFIIEDGAIVVAAREGVVSLSRNLNGGFLRQHIGDGSPGEIKLGKLRGAGGGRALATIEPWHGTDVVIYREPAGAPRGGTAFTGAPEPRGRGPWQREVIESGLTEGHALAWADGDGDGEDELFVGWRKAPFGVARYRRQAGLSGAVDTWSKTMVDDGGMAAEDIAAGDLDADGRPDLVAGGRATGNLRLYLARPEPRAR